MSTSTELFLNLGSAKSNQQLKELLDKFSGAYDPHYVTICVAEEPLRRAFKERLAGMWRSYEPYAEADFLSQLRKHEFQKRVWEMYLADLLQRFGGELKQYRSKKTTRGPDLKILYENQIVWVEATAPEGNEDTKIPWMEEVDEDGTPIPGLYGYSAETKDLDKPRILKITAAVAEKLKKYMLYLEKGPLGAMDPYVIAINGGDYDGFESDGRDVLTAILGVGDLVFSISPSGTENIFRRRATELLKRPELPIPTGLFLRSEYRYISALFYSMEKVVNCSPEGSELIVIFNPNANCPISPKLFPFGKHFTFDQENSRLVRTQ